MDIDVNHISLNDLVIDSHWDNLSLNFIFGNMLDNENITFAKVDYESENLWVWQPKPTSYNLSSAVYHVLNKDQSTSASWMGWSMVWHIPVAPRIKHFIWLCLHNRLSTTAFLHRLNLGPDNYCIFCGLWRETVDHLFSYCSSTQRVWQYINHREHLNINLSNGFSSGEWVFDFQYSRYSLAIIAAGAWFIWTSRCNAIFNNSSPNYSAIASKAIAHAREYSNSFSDPIGKRIILSNFSKADGQFIFTHATSNDSMQVRSIGFFIVDAYYRISLAGCISQPMDNNLSGILLALEVALQSALDSQMQVQHIFTDHANTLDLIENPNQYLLWRFQAQIFNINFLLDMFTRPKIHQIPRHWMKPAAILAYLGFRHRSLNLFLYGRDLPYWVMKYFHLNDFNF
ncbi:uncharacterized protein LOC120273129 [Dioscorea cayenensis subsp. rotundata]|uniref:Uncharacterized protein LOC120273129 n=1 Tax=Dioscorea cayennensis subsp. rotundata TaxID=55577 RepID=A0AB40C7A9_DIOCR|nr:uncharacterized protein LOC120273129 [Dioscorea cayenensis subsp. rotundata]